jgi:predicted NBD/HSP70 family sugar kinase
MNTLGIELGSTRIKAVIIDEHHKSIASGSFDWENTLEDGVWTYSLDAVWAGIQSAVRDLPLDTVGAIGISAMMHGYLVFDKNNCCRAVCGRLRKERSALKSSRRTNLAALGGHSKPTRTAARHQLRNTSKT